jgi:hypothetical protein
MFADNYVQCYELNIVHKQRVLLRAELISNTRRFIVTASWSSGQSSWLQIRRPGFDFRHYQKKKE